jgi:hypothetical protein
LASDFSDTFYIFVSFNLNSLVGQVFLQ